MADPERSPQTRWIERVSLTPVNVAFGLILWSAVTFRWISLPFLLAVVVFGIKQHWTTRLVLWGAFFLASMSPIDVHVMSIPGVYLEGGAHRNGPRLVRYFAGLTSITNRSKLIQEYGEYYSGGCTGDGVFPLHWILVFR